MLFPLSAWIILHRRGVCLQSEESGRLFSMHLKSATVICDSNGIIDHNTQGYREVKRMAVVQKRGGLMQFLTITLTERRLWC